jgi:Mg/Co/Ni transporter MgtE
MEKITVSLRFEYYPEEDHAELFEDMTEDEMIRYAKEMANEDIINGDVWEWLEVSVE